MTFGLLVLHLLGFVLPALAMAAASPPSHPMYSWAARSSTQQRRQAGTLARDRLLLRRRDRFLAQRVGRARGLPVAARVERDVEMTLQALVLVPGRFAVAQRQDAGEFHRGAW